MPRRAGAGIIPIPAKHAWAKAIKDVDFARNRCANTHLWSVFMSADEQVEGSAALETDDVKAVDHLRQAHDRIVSEIRKIIVGMDQVIDEMMISIFSGGHCLLVGVPGLAKTLLVSCLADCLGAPVRVLGMESNKGTDNGWVGGVMERCLAFHHLHP